MEDGVERGIAKMMAVIVQEGPREEPAVWLPRFGWAPSVTDIATRIARHGRPVPPVLNDADDRVPVWIMEGSRTA